MMVRAPPQAARIFQNDYFSPVEIPAYPALGNRNLLKQAKGRLSVVPLLLESRFPPTHIVYPHVPF